MPKSIHAFFGHALPLHLSFPVETGRTSLPFPGILSVSVEACLLRRKREQEQALLSLSKANLVRRLPYCPNIFTREEGTPPHAAPPPPPKEKERKHFLAAGVPPTFPYLNFCHRTHCCCCWALPAWPAWPSWPGGTGSDMDRQAAGLRRTGRKRGVLAWEWEDLPLWGMAWFGWQPWQQERRMDRIKEGHG